jgi:hypothetical protein
MNRCLSLVVIVLLVTNITPAGEIHLPSNLPTSGSVNHFPFNPSWGPEWRYQLVFTPSMLGNKPVNITQIAFAPYGSGTMTYQDFEVRMSHTTVPASNAFATNLPNPQTVLFAKSHIWKNAPGQWSPLGLTGTFAYNGKDSLTIEVRYRSGTTLGGTGACYYAKNIHSRIWARGTGAYTASGGSKDTSGLYIRITTADANITLSGSPSPGGTVGLNLNTPSAARKPYQAASSLGLGPIFLGSRQLNLSLDSFLDITVNNRLPTVFQNFAGLLDSAGSAKASIVIPNLPVLKGLRIHSAYVILDPAAPLGILLISPTVTFTIT